MIDFKWEFPAKTRAGWDKKDIRGLGATMAFFLGQRAWQESNGKVPAAEKGRIISSSDSHHLRLPLF